MGLNALLELFLDNLLPVLLAVFAGYLVAKFLNIDPQPLSRVTFYIFSPALLFTLLTSKNLSDGDIFKMATFTLVLLCLVGLVAWIVGRLFRFERKLLAAVVITSMLVNAGNFGLAVVLFGVGESALAYASVFFVIDAILAYTVGVFVVSLGKASISQALKNLLRVPAIYAMFLALAFLYFSWQLPLPVERSVTLLADASIPAMLVLLGMQLKSVRLVGNVVPLVVASTIRLIFSPLLALGLALLFQLKGSFQQAAILQSAMPAAVLTTVIATEYDVVPKFVTSVVFTTTLLSIFTLTLLLAYLGG